MAEAYSAPSPEMDDDSGMEVDTPSSEPSESQTALIPLEFFSGKELKPGVECKIRIDRVMDGQAQVSYVPHEEESAEMEDEPVGGDEEMAGYMEA